MFPNRAALFENFCNVKHTVLGKTLKPFALLHMLWLDHCESPFIYTDKPVTAADLKLALVICSCDSSEAILAALEAEKGFWRRLTARRCKDLETEVRNFLAYVKDYYTLPEYVTLPNNNYIEQLPWVLNLATFFIRETNLTEKEVWTMPLGKLFWYDAAIMLQKTGDTNVVTDAMKAAQEALRRLTGGQLR